MSEKKAKYKVTYTFEDGDMTISLKELALQHLQQTCAMVGSDDPIIKMKGKRELGKIADALCTVEQSRLDNLFRSRKPRPKAKSSVKETILQRMKKEKREGATFHGFLQGWLNNPFGGLIIERHGSASRESEQEFIVYNEETGKEAKYSYSTLQRTYWPTCDK